MRLVVVSHSSVIGAYQGKLREIADLRGVDVHLIVPHAWFENNRDVVAEVPLRSKYDVHVLKAYRLGRIASFWFDPITFGRLVRRLKPDVIYAEEEPWSIAAWQAFRCALHVDARFVFFTWENIDRSYKPISELILKEVLHSADGAVAGSKEAMSILQRRGFRHPIAVMPQYGIDPEVYSSTHIAPPGIETMQRPRIGYIGRLEKEKGVHDLLEAVQRLKGSWSLMILGNGSEKQALIEQTRQNGIADKLRFFDGVHHEKIPAYLQNIDMLVLPSRTTPEWKEQFGRILIEAMAAGVPIVASDSGAIPEVVGDAGMIVPEGDPGALAEALGVLLNSHERRAEIAVQGRMRSQAFSDHRIAFELHRFLRSISAGKN